MCGDLIIPRNFANKPGVWNLKNKTGEEALGSNIQIENQKFELKVIYERKIKNNVKRLEGNSKVQKEQFERELSFKFANEDEHCERVLKEYVKLLEKRKAELKRR